MKTNRKNENTYGMKARVAPFSCWSCVAPIGRTSSRRPALRPKVRRCRCSCAALHAALPPARSKVHMMAPLPARESAGPSEEGQRLGGGRAQDQGVSVWLCSQVVLAHAPPRRELQLWHRTPRPRRVLPCYRVRVMPTIARVRIGCRGRARRPARIRRVCPRSGVLANAPPRREQQL